MLSSWSVRQVLLVICAACVAVLAYGMYLQHVVGLEPCPMCIVQRYALILVALLSIYPTVFLLRQRKSADETIAVPASVIRVLRAELILLAVIPVLAFLMARGIGLETS